MLMKICRVAAYSLLAATGLHAQQPLTNHQLNQSIITNKPGVSASSIRPGFFPTQAVDGDFSNPWQSGPPLPSIYTEDPALNQLSQAQLTASAAKNLSAAIDGNFDSSAPVWVKNGKASLELKLPAERFLQLISLKFLTHQQLDLKAFDAKGNLVFQQSFDQKGNYRKHNLQLKSSVARITLNSSDHFDVFEVAALGETVFQDLVIDMEKSYQLDSLSTRIGPDSDIDSVVVSLSQDSLSWSRIASPELPAYRLEHTQVKPLDGRYLRYRFYLQPKDWTSVVLYEAAAFGELTGDDDDDTTQQKPTGSWDPMAGVDHYNLPVSRVDVTSQAKDHPKSMLIDGNLNQGWEAIAPYPDYYMRNPEHNILMGRSFTNFPSGVSAAELRKATDGQRATEASIELSQRIQMDMQFAQPLYMSEFSINALLQAGDTLDVFAVNMNHSWLKMASITSKDNYQTLGKEVNQRIQRIVLRSNSGFSIREIAATGRSVEENAVLDLGGIKPVSYIQVDYNGDSGVDSVAYFTSTDSLNWDRQLSFVPNLYGEAIHALETPVDARYIMAKGYVMNKDYRSFNLGEIRVYDNDGIYGDMPPATANQRPLGDIMGVNGIWGWGNNVYSDRLDSSKGPGLFSRVAKHARNYQNMWWDTDDPDNTPDFANMDLRLWWLDWDREYAAWDAAGIDVNVTLQFLSAKYPAERWDNPEKAAYDYGYAFARHFGPTHGNGLVKLFEIGNEPWYYKPAFYEKVLYHMARGVRDADPNLPLFPCALQSHEISREKNFIGTHMSERTAELVDGLNVHAYSYMYDAEKAARISTYPENPLSGMRSLVQEVKFRDANMPGKDIIVSEWGWDSKGYGLDCEHSECVSAKAQSDYAVRGLLYLDRLGVDQATWFFYGDSPDAGGLYSRSGLTVSGINGNIPHKRSFKAWQSVRERLGSYYFSKTLKENRDAWIYEYSDASGEPAYLVAWLPIDADDPTTRNFTIPYNYQPDSAFILDGSEYSAPQIANPGYANGRLTLELTATPILIKLKNQKVEAKSSFKSTKNASSDDWTASIYPNPSNGSFKLNLAKAEGQYQYRVYDLSGAILFEEGLQNVDNRELQFNFEGLKKGQYFIEIEHLYNQQSKVKKLPFTVM